LFEEFLNVFQDGQFNEMFYVINLDIQDACCSFKMAAI